MVGVRRNKIRKGLCMKARFRKRQEKYVCVLFDVTTGRDERDFVNLGIPFRYKQIIVARYFVSFVLLCMNDTQTTSSKEERQGHWSFTLRKHSQ
jgi:hypothetical protein